MMIDYLLSFLIITGAVLTLIGSIGLFRFKDFYTRLHGPTKASTLGVGSLLIASVIYFSMRGDGISFHEILITLFLFVTAPISAHMLAKAALHLNLKSLAGKPQKFDEKAQNLKKAQATSTNNSSEHANQ